MANSKLKLYYFDGKGRAEVVRIILAAAGKQYEDIRFTYETWPKYKPLAPFGQAPFLDIDGKAFAESYALNKFLAREFGFHGQTNLESLEIDQVVYLCQDFGQVLGKAIFEGDQAQIKENIAKVKAEECPKYLRFYEKLLKESGTGYFVGKRLTLADICVFDTFTGYAEKVLEISDEYPLLKKFIQTVKAHNKIGPYIASRPETPF